MRKLIATLTLVLSCSLATAHEQRSGPRGGALVDAGNYHVELVTAEKSVEVFVSDSNDKPLPAAGFKALAILAVGGKTLRINLEPAADGEKLVGQSAETLPKRVRGAVQLTGADGKTSTGRIN